MSQCLRCFALMVLSAIITTNAGSNIDSESRLVQLEQTVLDLQTSLQTKEQKDAAALTTVLSQLASTTDELTNVKAELRSIELEFSGLKSDHQSFQNQYAEVQRKLDAQEAVTKRLSSKLNSSELILQSKLQEQEQKCTASVSNLISNLISTADALTGVKIEIQVLKSNFSTMKNEHQTAVDELQSKMKIQESVTQSLTSDLNTSITNLQLVTANVGQLTLALNFSNEKTDLLQVDIQNTQSSLATATSTQASLKHRVDSIGHDLSKLKTEFDNDPTCSSSTDPMSTVPSISVSGCPMNFLNHGSSCYYFATNSASFIDAHSWCQFFSSHLTVISTKEEDDFVRGHLNTLGHVFSYFIGGTDLRDQSTWTWECPVRNVTFFNWYHGQPDNRRHHEYCLAMHPSFEYRWQDIDCKSINLFICERKVQ